jgi:hypothetical protein
MKKFIVFCIISAILAVFSCTLPSKIEITGTPEISFNTEKSITEMFEEMIGDFSDDDDDDASSFKIPCVNTECQTYIIYMNLHDKPVDPDLLDNDLHTLNNVSFSPSTGNKIIMDADTLLLEDVGKSISFGGGINGFLAGFEFLEIDAKIYLSGSEIIKHVKIDINIENGSLQGPHSENDPSSEPSGYESWVSAGNKYSGTTIPSGGLFGLNIAPYVMSGEDLRFKFNVTLKGNREIDLSWLDDPIKVEFVIWYPLKFKALDDNTKLSFPDDFFGDNDLFGREEQDSNSEDDSSDESKSLTDIIKSLELRIELNNNPFKESTLNVKSDKGNLTLPSCRIDQNFFILKIDEEEMEKINDPEYIPFQPKISFIFNKDSTLEIPWDIKTGKIYFSAKIQYVIE